MNKVQQLQQHRRRRLSAKVSNVYKVTMFYGINSPTFHQHYITVAHLRKRPHNVGFTSSLIVVQLYSHFIFEPPFAGLYA